MPWIDLDLLMPDARNANHCCEETLTKLKANIQRTGLCPPLIIRPHSEGGYYLIDGHHRLKVLRMLAWEKAPCQIWDITDEEAQIALLTLNRLRGTDHPRKRAQLIEGLSQTFSIQAISDLLPESPSEIEDLLSLLRLDMQTLEKAFQEQIEKERQSLPVAFTFLIPAPSAQSIEAALALFPGSDRGEALVALCQRMLEVENDKP